MTDNECRWYSPKRSLRQSLPFLIVFGIFILGGIPVMILGITGAGIAVSGMGLAFYALLVPQAAAVGKRYGLSRECIILKTFSRERKIDFSGIESVAIMSKTESRRFMEELYRASVDAERQMNIGLWLRSNKKAAETVRYMSIPVTGTEMRRGHTTNITSYSVNPDAELLLLRIEGGESLLISPLEGRGFYSELMKLGVASRPASVGEGLSVRTGDFTVGDNRRRVMLLSVIIFVIVAAVAGSFVFLSNRDVSADPDVSSRIVESSETSPAELPLAAWVDDNSYIFGIPKVELPEMERAGGVSSMLFNNYAAPVLLSLLEADGELPVGTSERTELTDYLAEFLLLHSMMSFVGEESAEDGTELNFFVVEQTDMRNTIASLIKNF